jgi:hypothetical protein
MDNDNSIHISTFVKLKTLLSSTPPIYPITPSMDLAPLFRTTFIIAFSDEKYIEDTIRNEYAIAKSSQKYFKLEPLLRKNNCCGSAYAMMNLLATLLNKAPSDIGCNYLIMLLRDLRINHVNAYEITYYFQYENDILGHTFVLVQYSDDSYEIFESDGRDSTNRSVIDFLRHTKMYNYKEIRDLLKSRFMKSSDVDYGFYWRVLLKNPIPRHLLWKRFWYRMWK